MTIAHAYVDGSCVQGTPWVGQTHLQPHAVPINYPIVPRRQRGPEYGPGGWAAIVEIGSDGYVLRGRVEKTTNTRMELRAAIEGLRSLEAGQVCELHTDCNLVHLLKWRWLHDDLPSRRKKNQRDYALWFELVDQFKRFGMRNVRIVPIPAGGHHIHRRAHTIAGAEARALARGEESPLVLPPTRKDARTWLLAMRDGRERVESARA